MHEHRAFKILLFWSIYLRLCNAQKTQYGDCLSPANIDVRSTENYYNIKMVLMTDCHKAHKTYYSIYYRPITVIAVLMTNRHKDCRATLYHRALFYW